MTTVKILPASLEQAPIEARNAAFVTPLIEVFERNNITYSFTEGGIDYVTHDRFAVDATNAYPAGIAAKLADKKQLQDTLASFGFNTLPTEVITDADSITLTNFIVKLKEGSGSNLPKSAYKNWFGGVLFADKEAFKRHPLFADMFAPGKYIAQQAVGNVRNHTVVSFFCAVNSNSDTYFLKNSTDTWTDSIRTQAILASEGYEGTKELLAKFVKDTGIKNTTFGPQFIVDDSGALYPIDWNFRWGKNFHTQVLKNAPDLYEFGVLYMVGANPTLPNISNEEWISTKEDIAALWV